MPSSLAGSDWPDHKPRHRRRHRRPGHERHCALRRAVMRATQRQNQSLAHAEPSRLLRPAYDMPHSSKGGNLIRACRAQRMFLWERRNLTIAPFNETVQQARLPRCARRRTSNCQLASAHQGRWHHASLKLCPRLCMRLAKHLPSH